MRHSVLIGLICLLSTSPAQAAGIGISAKIGTLGIGVELTKSLVPLLNVRGSFNVFSYSFTGTQDEIEYDMDLKLRSGALLLDLHPILGRGFRLSGGLFFNKNELAMVSEPSTTYEIGGTIHTGTEVGTVNGGVDFNSLAPYVGIGWGNAANSRIGIVSDLGVLLQGSPNVSLRATGPIASDQTFVANLNQEANNVEDNFSRFKYYPVISVGVSVGLGVF